MTTTPDGPVALLGTRVVALDEDDFILEDDGWRWLVVSGELADPAHLAAIGIADEGAVLLPAKIVDASLAGGLQDCWALGFQAVATDLVRAALGEAAVVEVGVVEVGAAWQLDPGLAITDGGHANAIDVAARWPLTQLAARQMFMQSGPSGS